ncbi:MAG: SDR family NAD(P)-dependent oxidoreductase [Cloacibacillus sp.]
MRLKDKIAVFIGGASDIATTTALKFIEEGASVALIDYDQKAFDRVQPQYLDNKGTLRTFIADVRDYEALRFAIDEVLKEFGRIDILVNCAGILIHKPIDVLTVREWQDVIDINLTGIFNACKAVTPSMKEHKYGRIVNISSIGGRTGRPGVGVNYAAAKAGIVGLTQTLAKELAPWTVTANVVAPGPLKGRMFFGMEQHLIDGLIKNIPLGRVGEMDEIAYAIMYLASDEAAWTTGEVLDVNGGAFI